MLTPEKITLLASSESQDFIKANADTDVQKLILKKSPLSGLDSKDLATQVAARKKAASKLPVWAGTPGLIFPESLAMEQCSSEETARYKQQLFSTGSSIVDLTGGFGIDSFWISENASNLDYVERQEYLCDLARHNFKVLSRDNVNVINQELEEYLKNWEQSPTDFVYCDPARRNENQRKVFLLEDCSPDVAVLAPIVFAKGATLIAKLSPMFDISALVKAFGDKLAEIHVVAVKNECKELIVILKLVPSATRLICANLESGQAILNSTIAETVSSSVSISEPLNYLYEANAAIMKGGAADFVANQFGLKKIGQHSFLYTSEELLENFPGRRFEIKAVSTLDKRELATLIPTKKANISTRNFPLKPEEIFKKIGFATGGEEFLFASTLGHGKKVIIWSRKVTSSETNL